MTLVEVIGGLALLATLLVAMLLAKGRYTRQSAIADRRLAAVTAADALLAGWHQDASSLVRAGAGPISGGNGLSWRTRIVANPAVNALDAQVVRLEILDDRPTAAATPMLASVEFVVDSSTAKAVHLTLAPTDKRRAKPKSPAGR